MSEKPYAHVAEALGWRVFNPDHLCGYPPSGVHGFERCLYENNQAEIFEIPDYDTDWSATGPLIERYGILLEPPQVVAASFWRARVPFFMESGATPLEAVCKLILALHAAGKLRAA